MGLFQNNAKPLAHIRF